MSHSETRITPLKAFLRAEMVRCGLDNERDVIVRLIDELETLADDLDPPDGYHPVVYGPRSEDEHRQLLVEGENSGPAVEATPGFWQERKRRFFKKHDLRNS